MTEYFAQFFPSDSPFTRPMIAFILLTLRYFLIAGGAFIIYYVLRADKKKLYKKIQTRFATAKDFKREIAYSMSTFFVFSAMIFIIRHPLMLEYSKIYKDIHEHSWAYFFFTIILMIIIHDTYFYWAHRLMHHPKIYDKVHKVHHLSINPSPWASFSFHPLEAVIEFSVVIIFSFLFPVHVFALLTFSLFMMLENVMGHLGYEFLPKYFNKNPLTKWVNTSTNHNMHHQYFKSNYGLYFTFWDRIMGTLHPKYEARFEEVAGMKLPEEAESNHNDLMPQIH